MSYLLEALGRGLLADLRSAFESQLPAPGKEGSEALRARLEVSPDSFDLAMRLGMACLSQVRLSEARDAFEKARQLRPVSAQPLVALACVNDELGHLDGAIKYLNALVNVGVLVYWAVVLSAGWRSGQVAVSRICQEEGTA